jgi:SIR2-like domain
MRSQKFGPGMLAGVPPEVSLALALHNAHGTYAVFLGSGVSVSAEIPTGRGVTLDLIRQIATAEGEEAGTDPEEWYRHTFSEEPDYSQVLEKLARTRQERRDILHPYFEPTEEDREEGRKVPTRGHHAVAALAAKGCVKVILTTNFDRLMERALEEAGIDPVVISSEEDIEGAPSLQHAGVTVVKINGDYMDTRIRNTAEELASYSPKIEALLRRIFDEYGLVISGWSGVSDTAILQAMRGTRSRRYTLYYASRGAPSEEVQRMVNNLQGVVIESSGADELFSDLLERVEALERFGSDDPITAAVAVQRVKRFLEEEGRHIRLRELVVAEGRDLRTTVFDADLFPLDWRPTPGGPNTEQQQRAEEYRRRILSHDRLLAAAVGMMAAGGTTPASARFARSQSC